MGSYYSHKLDQELTVIRELGEGHSGIVYLVEDRNQNTYVLKLLKLEELSYWKNVERFQREMAVLASLNNDHIPDYYDLIDTGKTLGILQEYIEGKTFSEIIKDGKIIEKKEAVRLLEDGLAILDDLGNQRPPIIHRDISPNNLMIDSEGKLWLLDFGAARWMDDESGTITCMGTFGYMAPEQIVGYPVPKSDLYSFGVSLLSLLTRTDVSDFPIIPETGGPDFEWAIKRIPEEIRYILRGITLPGVGKRGVPDHPSEYQGEHSGEEIKEREEIDTLSREEISSNRKAFKALRGQYLPVKSFKIKEDIDSMVLYWRGEDQSEKTEDEPPKGVYIFFLVLLGIIFIPLGEGSGAFDALDLMQKIVLYGIIELLLLLGVKSFIGWHEDGIIIEEDLIKVRGDKITATPQNGLFGIYLNQVYWRENGTIIPLFEYLEEDRGCKIVREMNQFVQKIS